jgi:hypothetical protein
VKSRYFSFFFRPPSLLPPPPLLYKDVHGARSQEIDHANYNASCYEYLPICMDAGPLFPSSLEERKEISNTSKEGVLKIRKVCASEPSWPFHIDIPSDDSKSSVALWEAFLCSALRLWCSLLALSSSLSSWVVQCWVVNELVSLFSPHSPAPDPDYY